MRAPLSRFALAALRGVSFSAWQFLLDLPAPSAQSVAVADADLSDAQLGDALDGQSTTDGPSSATDAVAASFGAPVTVASDAPGEALTTDNSYVYWVRPGAGGGVFYAAKEENVKAKALRPDAAIAASPHRRIAASPHRRIAASPHRRIVAPRGDRRRRVLRFERIELQPAPSRDGFDRARVLELRRQLHCDSLVRFRRRRHLRGEDRFGIHSHRDSQT